MEAHIEIPPFGYVDYIDHLGSDLRIVAAARTSTDSVASKGEEQDRKLLEYLYRNRHTSPFEQCNVTFGIKMPIFVMRQFVRHRTFRLNEWSGRYSELGDEFFVPPVWRRKATKENKQGSSTDIEGPSAGTCNALAEQVHKIAFDNYQHLLHQGVSNELARIVLPVSCYTKIVINADLHNLMHFFRLRLDPHAQKEIQDVAKAMYSITKELYPWTIAAFEKFKVNVEDQNAKCTPPA